MLHEPQFALLCLQTLLIDAVDVQPPPDAQALAAWAATHTSLKRLELWNVRLDSEAALDAVVNLAISQLKYCALGACSLSPDSLPGLTRMLESHSLTALIMNNGAPLLLGAAVPAFCTALRTSRLELLMLQDVCLWESLEDGLAVLAACTGHSTLRELVLNRNNQNAPAPAAVGGALAALVASDSVLESLDVSTCSLDDAAMRLIFAAVAGSTRLRELDCSWNDVTAECAREAILPAVRANSSLRILKFEDADIPELLQAVELVSGRLGVNVQ